MGLESEIRLIIKENADTVEEEDALENMLKPFFTDNDITITTLTKITSMDLSNSNIKYLPPDFSVLNLREINLSHNNLECVPAFLYNSQESLERLDLSYNQITDFEREPHCLNNIKIVNLSYNQFKNVPRWFLMFKAFSLEEFNYSHNAARHYNYLKNSFNCIRNTLHKLELRSCQLIDHDFMFLRQFKHLRYLDIGNEGENTSNNLREIEALFVKLNWKTLFILKAEHLGIVIFPNGILWLESLIELHMCGNCLTWLPNDFDYLFNLQILDVSENFLVHLPNSLVALKDLTIIKASHNTIQSCPDFSLMPRLEILDLYHNSLEEVSLNFGNLRFVDIEYNILKTETFDSYVEYTRKKNEYRETITSYRYDGHKPQPRTDDDLDYESKCSDEYASDAEINQDVSEPLEIENWDDEISCTTKVRNPNVDSDDDWTGEEVPINQRNFTYTEEVYYDVDYVEEDWMFEDVS